MALATASPLPLPSPQVIGSAFVQQYYHILHQSPEMVYKFYHDSSIVNRPNPDGDMTSVTTMQGINDKIMSLDFRNCFTEIETADSQISYQNGVLIVVTGSFTGQDNVRRKFAQSFFLAPQENGGYFVLNDVFRFLNEAQPRETNHLWDSGTNDDAPRAPLTPEADFISQEHRTIEVALSDEDAGNAEEAHNQSEDHGSGVEDEVSVYPQANVDESHAQPVHEVMTLGVQDDTPKKSYASIVKVMTGSPSPAALHVTPKPKVATVNSEKPVAESSTLSRPLETSVPVSNNVPENNSNLEEEGHSIYVRNLPLYATAEQIEEEFKKFGPIKPGGVQVRSHKVERYCFGFVEFELLKSMQAAIEASPIMIGGRQAIIQEKRTTTRVVNGVVTNSVNGTGGRGHFQPGRGAFRNDNFRIRGGFGSNMGYRRAEFRNRVEYSGRGRGSTFHRGDAYQQRAFQNGNGLIGDPKGPGPAAVTA